MTKEGESSLPRPPRWSGRAWLLTTLALGFALIVSALANWYNVRRATTALNHGQAEMLHSAVRGALGPPGREVNPPLDSLVDAMSAAGLRYIALLRPDGSVIASGGEPVDEPIALPLRGGLPGTPRAELIEVDDRIRVVFGVGGPTRVSQQVIRPQPGPSPDVALPPTRDRGGPQPGFPGGPGNPRITRVATLLEFAPVHAARLNAQAWLALLLSGLGAAVLMAAALGFYRVTQRYERAQLEFQEQRRLRVLGEMSAVMAHEIRNPLASLKGHAQLLAEQLAAETAERRRADRVVHEANRLEVLTTDLLEFARAGELEVRMASPTELANAAAAETGAAVTVDTSNAPREWPLDRERLHRALVNLLRNALQASNGAKPPLLTVTGNDDALTITVRDYGAGIADGTEERIFDPFFTTRTTGTGLGLAVVRRIVEMHGGTVVARTPSDGGAEFRITLPQRRG